MGRHSAANPPRRARTSGTPKRIERLDPASTSSETPRQQRVRREKPDFGERQRRRVRRKRAALGCLSALVLFVLVAAAAGLFYVRGLNAEMQGNKKVDEAIVDALDKPTASKKNDPFYMLLMGIDSRAKGEAARSDTLIIARIDPDNGRVTLVSIPRDTRVNIEGHGKTKINAAHAYGGPALVIKTVKEITGLPISHYAEVDFQGFKDVVDALGGVTVDVPEDIDDMKASNHVRAFSKLNAGTQVLDGGHALTFVRSREFPRGDLQRIENQQTFFKALLKEMLKTSNMLRLPSVISAMAQSVTTDLSVGDMVSIANKLKGMDEAGLETVTMPGEPQMIGGGSYVVMDEDAFAEMIERVKAGQPAELPDAADAPVQPYQVSVTVKNGAGISGVGADAARRLRGADFDVGEVGNMNQFVYEETLVVYKDQKQAAELVAAALEKGKVVASRGMYSFTTDVLLVVGEDWGAPVKPRINQIPVE